MFYCNDCGIKKGWPINHWHGSNGRCEICGQNRSCNDIACKDLPKDETPKQIKKSEIIRRIKANPNVPDIMSDVRIEEIYQDVKSLTEGRNTDGRAFNDIYYWGLVSLVGYLIDNYRTNQGFKSVLLVNEDD